MATTTNYGWVTPDDTALVKDGAAAIRTLGSSADTTTKNLNPETTLGDISFRSSTSNVNTRLGIGTAGQVLTVVGGLPAYATPAAGGMTLLSSGALSSTSTTYNVVVTGFTYLQIFMVNVFATTDNNITMRINGDTASNYGQIFYTSGPTDSKNPSVTSYRLTNGTGTSDDVKVNANADIKIFDPTSTSQMMISHQAMCGPSGDMRFNVGNGNYDCSAAVTSLTFLHASGSFSSGDIFIYGVK